MHSKKILGYKVHETTYEWAQDSFNTVANDFSLNENFNLKLNGKPVRYRYERVQKTFDENNRAGAKLYEVGDELNGQH